MTTLRSHRRTYGPILNDGIAYFPLLLLIGLIIFCSPSSTSGYPACVNLLGPLTAIGVVGATMLYALRLKESRAALTRRLQESDELNQLVLAITSAEKFEGSIADVLRSLSRKWSCTSAAFISVGVDRTSAAWRFTSGATDLGTLERIDRANDGSADRVGERCGLSCIDLSSRMRCLSKIVPGCRCALTIPITLPDSTRIGLVILGFARKRSFGSDQRRWLSAVSRGIALPLERIRMQDEMKRLAYTDPMTNLANYRAFRSYLQSECRRADRYEHSPSLLILDIDWFKSINDRFGHPVGDDVLRHVSALIQYHVRSIDIPARYGGEEFAVVCPETDTEAAVVLAERLRSAIEESPFLLPTGDRLSITVSIGVARYQHSISSEEDLIAAADAALYQSKRMGRNQVQSANPLHTRAGAAELSS